MKCSTNELKLPNINVSFPAIAQDTYEIDVRNAEQKIITGHLDLGGSNPAGDSISVNNYYLKYNQKPFYPIIGEFHFSRYPPKYWEEAILKMKAGGINVIATYVFWNMHERNEGEFDWEGRLNLRRFIELIEKHHMKAIVRLGPFDHGEIRNGGLPNWLYGRPFDVRSNDPAYLKYAERLYNQIGQQIEGKLFKDGGPVIGAQLENEFQHSAGTWWLHYPGSPTESTAALRDENVIHAGVSVSEAENEHAEYGSNHMENLKKMARDAGIDVPLYTATGWGNAAIVKKGSIPVTAGYAYPTWLPEKPSPFFLYKDIHKNPDYSPVSYDPERYPSIPAELGTGIMDTYSRRPTVDKKSILPMMVRMIGSGSNGIGYYMYHGGSTPVFDGHFYNQEVSGYTKISYDFQAPIGEFGKTRAHYRSLKLLHFFLESYGEQLAPMETVLPETNGKDPSDIHTLRYAVRSDGDSGFIFMHNFQDHLLTNNLQNLKLNLQTASGPISMPSSGSFNLNKGVSAILPFNLQLGDLKLKYPTAQPLTILNRDGEDHYVFFSNDGMNPEFVFENDPEVEAESQDVEVKKEKNTTKVSAAGNIPFSFNIENKHFLVIPKAMALKAWKTEDERMIFSNAVILEDEDQFEVISSDEPSQELTFYPGIETLPKITGAAITKKKASNSFFSTFDIRFKEKKPPFEVEKITDRRYLIKSTGPMGDLSDVMMNIDYAGDRAMAFIDGKLVADQFYHGEPWKVGMKKFKNRMQVKDMLLMLHPMQKDAEYLQDFDENKIPEFDGKDSYLKLNSIDFTPEYKAAMVIQ